MPISDIISVTVSIELAAQIARAFGVPLIAGVHSRFAERYRIYTAPSEMLTDGFLTSDPEYAAAQILMGQDRRPPYFIVGRRAAPVARVVTITIGTVTSLAVYLVTINDGSTVTPIAVDFTADADATMAEVQAGIVARANLLLANVTAAPVSTNQVSLTADVPGTSFSITEADTKLSFVETTPNTGAASDLQAIDDAGALWWGGMLTSRTRGDQLDAAAWIGSSVIPHALILQTSDVLSTGNAYDTSDIDMLARIKALSYGRAAGWWHYSDAEYLDAMILGNRLPRASGTETWANVRGSGVSPSPVASLSATGRTNLNTRNASYYYEVSPGVSITYGGKMGDGQWIDQVRLGDAIQADVSERILNCFVQNDKVPMDDNGITLLANQLRATFASFVQAGSLDGTPPPVVYQPSEDDISPANRAARILDPPITGSGRSTGAIHKANIEVTITQ